MSDKYQKPSGHANPEHISGIIGRVMEEVANHSLLVKAWHGSTGFEASDACAEWLRVVLADEGFQDACKAIIEVGTRWPMMADEETNRQRLKAVLGEAS